MRETVRKQHSCVCIPIKLSVSVLKDNDSRETAQNPYRQPRALTALNRNVSYEPDHVFLPFSLLLDHFIFLLGYVLSSLFNFLILLAFLLLFLHCPQFPFPQLVWFPPALFFPLFFFHLFSLYPRHE